MESFISFVREKLKPSFGPTAVAASPTSPNEKEIDTTSADDADYVGHSSHIPRDAEAGELTVDETTAGGLGRHLGVFSTTFLIIGRIIGTGIFSTPSSITRSVGSVGAALMLWILGFVLSFAGLLVWLELGCMIPRSGGEKVYLEAAYRRPKLLATTAFAFNAIALGFTAAGCIVFASNMVVAANRTPSGWEERGIAIIVISIITVFHTVFPGAGVRAMNILGMIKLFILLFVIVTGWVVLGHGVKSIPDPNASFRHAFRGSATSGNLYATALFKVLNSYAGWSNAGYVLNEVKNPVRTLKIAGPLGLTTCGILYLGANISYFASGTPAQIEASSTTVAAHFFGRVFGLAGQQALAVLVATSAFGNVMVITFAQSRVNQELAKEGIIPFGKFWASSWPRGSPSTGLLLHFIPSFIVIVAIPFGDAYNFLLDIEGYPGAVINLFVVIGFFILRFTEPARSWARPFKVCVPVAVFYLVAQAFLMVAPFLRPPRGIGDTPPLPYWLYAVVGIAVLASAVTYWVLVYWVAPKVFQYKLRPVHEVLADGTRVVVYRRMKEE